MLRLALTCIFLVSGVTAAPRPDFYNHETGFFDYVSEVSDGWLDLEGILPETVVTYLEKSAKEGLEILEEVYNDTRKEAVDSSSKHVDEFTNILDNFIKKLENVYESAYEVAGQDVVLSDEEILNRKEAGDLQGTKEELDQLEGIVQKEREENVNIEGLEGQLQELITWARGLLSTAKVESDLEWSKLKQLELEFYQVAKLMADTSGQVKESLKQAWSTLRQELGEVSPALKDIVDTVTPCINIGQASEINSAVEICKEDGSSSIPRG